MSWVEPVGYLRLLRGIPLEPSYENTLYFTSATEQYNYFFNHPGISFDKLSYTRYNRGIIRVPRNIRECYDINYMMYCNDSGASPSGNRKWFYCFVTEVNYISEGATEIVFQPDVLQTWMFDYTLGRCFVERQHTETDEIGEWIEDEGLEPGPYIYEQYQDISEFNNWSVVVAANMEATYYPQPRPDHDGYWDFDLNSGGEIYGGIYSAIKYYYFDVLEELNNVTHINSDELLKLNRFFGELYGVGVLNNYDYTSKIVSVFMVPTAFKRDRSASAYEATDPYVTGKVFEKKIPIRYSQYAWTLHDPNTGNTYTPKNNKIYTYPYTGFLVTNQQDYTAVYPYEFFNPGNENCYFSFEGLVSPTTECQLVPLNYKNVTKNYMEKISLTGFPICSYTTDSFLAYISQVTSGVVQGGLNIYAGLSSSAMTINSAKSIHNQVLDNLDRYSMRKPESGAKARDVNNYYGEELDMMRRSNALLSKRASIMQNIGLSNGLNSVLSGLSTIGNSLIANFPYSGKQSSSIGIATKSFGFKFYNARITENYAIKIDSFFTKYGYKIMRNSIPNRYARTRFTYLKLSDINFTRCDMPTDIAEEITTIYKNGTTWWRAMWHMNGDVFVDDNPVGDYDFGLNSLRT